MITAWQIIGVLLWMAHGLFKTILFYLTVTPMNLVFRWQDGTATDYYNWADGEPNGQDNREDCVEISMEDHDKGK